MKASVVIRLGAGGAFADFDNAGINPLPESIQNASPILGCWNSLSAGGGQPCQSVQHHIDQPFALGLSQSLQDFPSRVFDRYRHRFRIATLSVTGRSVKPCPGSGHFNAQPVLNVPGRPFH